MPKNYAQPLAAFAASVICTLAGGINSAQGVQSAWTLTSGGNGHTYEVVVSAEPISWSDAKAGAESLGGYLATVTSADENTFVVNNVINQLAYWVKSPTSTFIAGPWIGGYQPDPLSLPADDWAWITGEAWAFPNWTPGEPNDFVSGQESYLHFVNYSDVLEVGSFWNDLPDYFGEGPIAYVVEYDTAVLGTPAIPEPSTACLFTMCIAVGVARTVRRTTRIA